MDYKKLGKRISQVRKENGLSQEQLAYRIDYSVPHISHVENAKTIMSLDFLVKTANALEVSTDQLLCDSLLYVQDTYKGEILKEVEDCDDEELKIITRSVQDLKKNLRENREKN